MSKIKLKRSAFVRDGVGVLQLTKGYETIIDIDMLPVLGAYNWYASFRGEGQEYPYVKRMMGPRGESKTIWLHREVLRLHGIDVPKGMVTDHINRDPLDNRFENLRVITNAMNVRNSDRWDKSRGTSYRNDAWRKKKYYARIRIGKKQISLGYYLTEEEAHEAYMKEAKKIGRML
jgi:hypothetical protein